MLLSNFKPRPALVTSTTPLKRPRFPVMPGKARTGGSR